MAERAIRLGIVGCGAATEQRHLPAARVAGNVRVVALVDKDLSRARLLGRRFGVSHCTEDYHDLVGAVDGVIVAVPNHLHAVVAGSLLENGVPVLVEKPLARTVAEGKGLIDLARRAGVPLQVGHMYRFSRAARLFKRMLDEGVAGALEGFSLEFGTIYGWPIASGFPWRKDQAGGGVLIDVGPHMLDLLLWWLGDVVDVEYWDDSLGGVEAECKLSLALAGRNGVIRGDVVFSRLRNLGTIAQVIGERFSMECGFTSRLEVRIRPRAWDGEYPSFVSDFGPSSADSFRQIYADQLRAFAWSIAEGSPPLVSGQTVLGSLELIERCYRERKPLESPWMERVASPVPA